MLRFAHVTKKLGAPYLVAAYGGYRALNQLASSFAPQYEPPAESNIHKRCELVVSPTVLVVEGNVT
jgi:hypothetical protein